MTAWAALILWPFLAAIFYRAMTLPAALCATLIGGYLLLPTRTEFDLPLLPALNKSSIPAITALLLTAIALRSYRRTAPVLQGWLPRHPVTLLLISMLILGSFGTVMTNLDSLTFGPLVLPGMRLYDGFSMALDVAITLIPFLLARKVLSSPEAQHLLLKVLVISASLYAVLALYEVRMSPQLNNMVYGFFPHSFVQHIRSSGWRPLVFLNHGLMLGIFLSSATIAAFGLFKFSRDETRPYWGLAGIWLFGTLLLSKNLGALLLTLLALGILFFLSRRLQLLAIAVIAGLVLIYPLPRSLGLVPVNSVISMAEGIDSARAASLQIRINNEEILLARAQERGLFGWGGYGRNRVYTEWGSDVSVTDGTWIILMGSGGWVRYVGLLGLLSLGAIALWFRRNDEVDPVTIVLGLGLAANLLDLIPNSGVSPLTWMMAGALAGRMELQSTKAIVSNGARYEALGPDRATPAHYRDLPHAGSTSPYSGGSLDRGQPEGWRASREGKPAYTRFAGQPKHRQ